MAWARAALATHLPLTPNILWPGMTPLRELFFEVLDYRSKIHIYVRQKNKRLQKFDRKAPKHVATLAFSPARARLGQVARALRAVVAAHLAFDAEGLTSRLASRDLLFLWLNGGLI